MAGILGFGGSSVSSSSQTLTNSTNISPVFNIGDSNKADTGFTSEARASSSASSSLKDEFGMSASVGVGMGGSGSGGTAELSRGGDTQPMSTDNASTNAALFGGSSIISGGFNPAYLLYAVILGGVVFAAAKYGKKKGE